MFKREGNWLGDTWYHVADGLAHMYYLTCPNIVERHRRWTIGHAVSSDLHEWTQCPDLFHSDATDPRRSCLSTGSVTHFEGRYIMGFLANHNAADPQVIYAESDDLSEWRELVGTDCSLLSSGYSTRGSLHFQNPRWRDPFLFVEDGWLYQLMTAADDALPVDADGVVGVMRTRDLREWEFLPPLQTPLLGTDLECPKLYRIDGRYVLLISMFAILQSPAFAALQPPALNPSTTFCMVADSLLGPYRFFHDGRVLDRDLPGGPYACEAVRFGSDWFLLGTCWSDRLGDRICDPIALQSGSFGLRNL